jgi:hypothetical protein
MFAGFGQNLTGCQKALSMLSLAVVQAALLVLMKIDFG